MPSAGSKTVRLVVHEITAACGTKAEIVDALTDRDALVLEIARDVMAGFLGFLPPATVRALHAKGRSMEPFVKDGQWVLYDPSDVAQASGQRFVLQIHEHDTGDWKLYLKRVQWLTGGGVRLISDNPHDGVEDETFYKSSTSTYLRRCPSGPSVPASRVAARTLFTPFARARVAMERALGERLSDEVLADALGVSRSWVERAMRGRGAAVRRGHLVALERLARLGPLRADVSSRALLSAIVEDVPIPTATVAHLLGLPTRTLYAYLARPACDVPAWVGLTLAEIAHEAGPGSALHRWYHYGD